HFKGLRSSFVKSRHCDHDLIIPGVYFRESIEAFIVCHHGSNGPAGIDIVQCHLSSRKNSSGLIGNGSADGSADTLSVERCKSQYGGQQKSKEDALTGECGGPPRRSIFLHDYDLLTYMGKQPGCSKIITVD